MNQVLMSLKMSQLQGKDINIKLIINNGVMKLFLMRFFCESGGK